MLLGPLVLAVALVLASLCIVAKKRPEHFGTTSGWPTPFRLMACVGGSMLLGHVAANLAVFIWAISKCVARDYPNPRLSLCNTLSGDVVLRHPQPWGLSRRL